MNCEDDEETYLSSQNVPNEDFWEVLDFAIKMICDYRIKKVFFGADYHYLNLRGRIRAYLSKRKHNNNKSLILKSKDWEIECAYTGWEEIKFTKDAIIIDDMRLEIQFGSSIWKSYQDFKKEKLEDDD